MRERVGSRGVLPAVEFLLLIALLPATAGAQNGIAAYNPHAYVIRAARVDHGPTLDGRLDEAVWGLAGPATGFTQRNPVEGAAASRQTEVRILYTDTTLYIGARMWEEDPASLVVTEMRRDAEMHGDDAFSVILDTFHDHRNGFQFTINPAGARYDAYVTDEGRDTNSDFNVVWDAATAVDAQGWTAEMAIPLSQLRFDGTEGEVTWGVNFRRTVRSDNEEDYWVPTPRDFGMLGFYRFSNAGLLRGMQDLRQPTNLQIKPYLLGGLQRHHDLDAGVGTDPVSRQRVRDAGLDLKYGLSSNMTLDLTWNTDFAQVEADQERVNLTRFSLFFPEKRDFFLEGAGIFGGGGRRGFGGMDAPDLQIFYSRRIGLEAGEEVPIIGGGKLTGRAGPWTVGALNVLTERTRIGSVEDSTDSVVPSTLWSVVSLRRNVMERSSVGLMALSKDPQAGDYNRTVSLDANLVLGDYTTLKAQGARVFDPSITGDAGAWTGAFEYNTDLIEFRANHLEIGGDFQGNEMGFIRRLGVRHSSADFQWNPRPGVMGIRQLDNSLSFSYLTDVSGRLQTRDVQLRSFVWMEDTSNMWLTLSRQFDLLTDPFYIYDDPDTGDSIEIPAGPYEWTEYSMRISSDGRHPVTLRGGLTGGGYYGGERLSGNLDLSWKPDAHLNTSIGYSKNNIWGLVDGTRHFQTQVMSLRVNYAFTPSLFTKAYLQYNDARNALISNYLLHWIVRDGTEIYLVYNEAYDTGPGWAPLNTNRALLLKATYLLLW